MSWAIESERTAPLSPADVFRFYRDPSTWGAWGHNTKWARVEGAVEEGATVHVKAGYGKVYPVLVRKMIADRYIECEVRPPGMLVVNSYALEPVPSGVRIRHRIEVSGRFAGISKAIGLDKLYTRLLKTETGRLVELALKERTASRAVSA
jgi:polyketide cyclase/dehydrase/lipid transport protein